MSYSLEFEIAGLPPMANSQLRGHWRARHGVATKWKWLVAKATLGKMPADPLAKAKLTLTRCSSNEPDVDGLVSGFKHVIDGLVEVGILANDKPSNIGMPVYLWEKAPQRKGKIKVKVEGVC